MNKFLILLSLGFSSLCWGQDTDVLGDWGDWDRVVEEQPQPELPDQDLAPPSAPINEPPAMVEHAQEPSSQSTSESEVYGVGLVGSDEQQLNTLDGSSLMDYDSGPFDVADQEAGSYEDEPYSDESIFDVFEGLGELEWPEELGPEEFDEPEWIEGPDDFDGPEWVEGPEAFDAPEVFADELNIVEEEIEVFD